MLDHEECARTASDDAEPKREASLAAPNGYAALLQTIRDLRCLMWEHHSAAIMRDEHYTCPVCSDRNGVTILNRADVLLRHTDPSSASAAPNA